MIYKIDSNSLVGSKVPNVYVQKVVLKDNSTASTSKNRLDSQELSSKQKESEAGVICNLTLGLKDLLNTQTEWSDNDKLYSQYKIGIVRSLDPSITDEFLSYRAPRSAQILTRAVALSANGKVAIQGMSLAGLTKEQLNSRASSMTGHNGHVVKSVALTHTDSDLPKDLQHLTYFVFVYPKLLETAKNLGPKARELVGMCHVERVIKNASVPDKTTLYVYKDNPKTIWAGAVHRMPTGEYHTGAAHSATSRVLRQLVVDNTKVQDQRFIKKAQEGTIQLLTPSTTDPNTSDSITGDDAIFTELFSSQDSQNNVRFLFGVNEYVLAIRHAKFGKMLSRVSNIRNLPPGVAQYLNLIDVKAVTIKRRRVDPNSEFNRLSSPVCGESRFNEEEVDSVIFQGDVTSTTAADGSSLLRMDVDAENSFEFSYYSGIDTGLQNATYGKYQYKVELEVIDRTEESIGLMINNLFSARKVLDSYLAEGSKPQNYNSKIDAFKETYLEKNNGTPWLGAIRTYAEVLAVISIMSGKSSMFSGVEPTVQAVRPMIHSATANADSVQEVIRLVDSSISTLSNLANLESNQSTTDARPNAKDRTSRASGRSAKIDKIEHYFENEFDADFSRDVGYDYLVIDEHKDDLSGLFSLEASSFFNRVDIETNKYFVSSDVPIDLTVKGKSYTQQDDLAGTDIGYLSPSKVRVLDSTYRLSETISPDKYQYRELEKDILSYNIGVKVASAPPSKSGANEVVTGCDNEQNATDDREKLIEKSFAIQTLGNIDIGRCESFFQIKPDGEEKDPTIAPSVTEPPYGSAVATKEEVTNFSKILGSALRDKGLPKATPSVIKSFNPILNCNDVFSNPNVLAREEKLKSLPNQIKSVILGDTTTDTTNMNWFSDENSASTNDILGAMFRLNFYALHKIEAFVGFGSSASGRELARKPNFVGLTRQRVDSIPVGSHLLCRLVPYTDKDFGLNGLPNNLKLPIYNEYFVIRKGVGSTVTAEPQSPSVSRVTPANTNGPDNTVEMLQYAHSTPPPAAHLELRSTRATRTRTQQQVTARRSDATVSGVTTQPIRRIY